MELYELRTLRLLEKVEEKCTLSQRALSKELNISVGLVNSFIKRLVEKGYVKISTMPTNRMKYVVTEKGVYEKIRLNYNFMKYSYHFYIQARRKLNVLFKELENLKVRQVIFFGATSLAEIAYISLCDSSIDLVAIVDDRNVHKKIFGYTVKPVPELDRISCDRILVTDDRGLPEVLEIMLSFKIPKDKIVWVN